MPIFRRLPAPLAALPAVAALLTACTGGLGSVPASNMALPAGFPAASISRAPAGSVNWPQFGMTAAHIGFNSLETTLKPSNVANLTQLWSFATGAQIEDPILVTNGTAYVNSGDGYLYAVNASTGSLTWKYQTYEGASTQNMPAVASGRIFVPCLLGGNNQKNAMCAISTSTGKRLWAYVVDCNCLPPAGVSSAPVASGNYVAFDYFNGSTNSAYLLVANASSGKPIWSTGLAHGPSFSTAAISNGQIYFDASGSNTCSANLASGAQSWCVTTGNNPTSAVSNGVVYVNTNGSGVFALNASSGAQLWQYSPTAGNGGGYYDPPAEAKGRVYVAGVGFSGNLYALDAASGAVDFITSSDGGAANTTSSPSIANGVAYVECGGFVCAFNAANGTVLYTPGGSGTQQVSPTIVNGVVYSACGPNSACAYGLKSGEPLR